MTETAARRRLYRPRQTWAEFHATAGPLPGHTAAPRISDPAEIPTRCGACSGGVSFVDDALGPYMSCVSCGKTACWPEGEALHVARGVRG